MSKKMKILFSTAGGKARNTQLGTGHIHRCMILADCMTNFENYFFKEKAYYMGNNKCCGNVSI